MAKVAMVATFTCVAGRAHEVDAVLTRQVEAAAMLDGVEVYSPEALRSHGDAASLKDVMPAFMELLDTPPQMSTYTPVAASGLDR